MAHDPSTQTLIRPGREVSVEPGKPRGSRSLPGSLGSELSSSSRRGEKRKQYDRERRARQKEDSGRSHAAPLAATPLPGARGKDRAVLETPAKKRGRSEVEGEAGTSKGKGRRGAEASSAAVGPATTQKEPGHLRGGRGPPDPVMPGASMSDINLLADLGRDRPLSGFGLEGPWAGVELEAHDPPPVSRIGLSCAAVTSTPARRPLPEIAHGDSYESSDEESALSISYHDISAAPSRTQSQTVIPAPPPSVPSGGPPAGLGVAGSSRGGGSRAFGDAGEGVLSGGSEGGSAGDPGAGVVPRVPGASWAARGSGGPLMVSAGGGELVDAWDGPSPAAIFTFMYGMRPVPTGRMEVIERALEHFAPPSALERGLLHLRVAVVLDTVKHQGWRHLGALAGGSLGLAEDILPYGNLE